MASVRGGGAPKITLRCDNSIAGLTELMKAGVLMVMVYYRKRTHGYGSLQEKDTDSHRPSEEAHVAEDSKRGAPVALSLQGWEVVLFRVNV